MTKLCVAFETVLIMSLTSPLTVGSAVLRAACDMHADRCQAVCGLRWLSSETAGQSALAEMKARS